MKGKRGHMVVGGVRARQKGSEEYLVMVKEGRGETRLINPNRWERKPPL